MIFKVGDIVRFKHGNGRTHIVTHVSEKSIITLLPWTKGNGWCYNEEYHSPWDELNVYWKVHWEYIELVNNNSWDGSILKFNFIKNGI